jgi:hypothetical protein
MEAFEDIEKTGYKRIAKTGREMMSPSYLVVKDGMKILMEFEREYGMTLLSSQRINGKESDTDLENIINV